MKKQNKVIQDKNVRSEEELKEMDIADFRASFCPYGYMDIQRAVEVVRQAGIRVDELVEAMEQSAKDSDTKMSQLDPVAEAYDMILQSARAEIEEATGKDICNDLKGDFYVAGNFMCTSYDYKEETKIEVLELINQIPEADRSLKLQLPFNQID